MRVVSGRRAFEPLHGRRESKYDFALTGELVELKPGDVHVDAVEPVEWRRKARVALRRRARTRGLRVYAQVLEDGTLAVVAKPRAAGGGA